MAPDSDLSMTVVNYTKCREDTVLGPAIVSEMDSTTVVLPGYSARVDTIGNLLLEPDRMKGTIPMTATNSLKQRAPDPSAAIEVEGVTVDLIENALRNAREEMDAVLFRTAMSPGHYASRAIASR